MRPRTERAETTTILQWNCRGFKDKAGELQQYIQTLEVKSDVIALEETNFILPNTRSCAPSAANYPLSTIRPQGATKFTNTLLTEEQ